LRPAAPVIDAQIVARDARRPKALMHRIFSLAEARQAGLERWHLEGASWARVGPALYASKDLSTNPMHLLKATRSRLPSSAAFSGMTAAWLHGLDVDPCDPIEVTVPKEAGVSGRSGIAVRRSALAKGDVVNVRGLPAISPLRTVGELSARLDLIKAVVIVDAALHTGLLRSDNLASWARAHSGHRGMRNLRKALSLADGGAESPMETRLRLVLVLGGLRTPKTQVTIRDRWGRVLGRPDLYYEEERLGIEYDGGAHRETLAEDNRRQNRLLNAGVRLLRFTGGDVLRNPETIICQVGAMLGRPNAKQPSAGIRGYEDAV
jgi:very-short-patch-repair endonuclease